MFVQLTLDYLYTAHQIYIFSNELENPLYEKTHSEQSCN